MGRAEVEQFWWDGVWRCWALGRRAVEEDEGWRGRALGKTVVEWVGEERGWGPGKMFGYWSPGGRYAFRSTSVNGRKDKSPMSGKSTEYIRSIKLSVKE